VVAIGFFAFYRINGQPAGLALWELFGTTNQIMGTLTLVTVTLYLLQRKRPIWYTAVPAAFMLVTTVVAMVIKLRDFWNLGTYLLLAMGTAILILALWLTVEAVIRLRATKAQS
jgi:carbon starvation protein